MNKKTMHGITLISLIITIVVMIILAAFSLNFGLDYKKDVNENKCKADLLLVQQAVQRQYLKYKTAGDENIKKGTHNPSLSFCSELGLNLNGDYYELGPRNLEEIGVERASDTYIVDYETCEVINKTQIVEKHNSNISEVYLKGLKD